MAKRGRPAKVAPDGTRRKTVNKGGGRIVYQLWLPGDAGKKAPTLYKKTSGRPRGRTSKLTMAHRRYLKQLFEAFASADARGGSIWRELLRQKAELLPAMSDVNQLVVDLRGDKHFRHQHLKGPIGDYGVHFMGQVVTAKAGKHRSDHLFRLLVTIARDPDGPESSHRKRRLLAMMRKRAAARNKLAADILSAVYRVKHGDERRLAQTLLDLASQRIRRKKPA